MKFDVYERVRDPLHGVGGVREGFAQVLDRCFSLRVHCALLRRAPGSMSSSSVLSKSSSCDTESRITERPAAIARRTRLMRSQGCQRLASARFTSPTQRPVT